MRDVSEFSLAGKDWFTTAEAAFYCGVSESQFRKHALAYGLIHRDFMGKQLYEKAALYRAIDASEPWHNSPGIRLSISRASLSPNIRAAMERLDRYEERRRRR